MKATEMLELLREFHRDKLLDARTATWPSARVVADYDFNNTYQYVIAREDMHLRWLADAIARPGRRARREPCRETPAHPGKGADAAAVALIEADRRVARSASSTSGVPRIDALPNARHRTMLQRDPRGDARAQALLRPGARRPHRSARPPRRRRRHRRRRAGHPLGRATSRSSELESRARASTIEPSSPSAATSATAAPPWRSRPTASRLILDNPVLSDIIETDPEGEGLRRSAALSECGRSSARPASTRAQLLDALLADRDGLRPHAAVSRRRAHARSGSGAVRRQPGERAGPRGPASAFQRTLLRARAAGRDRAGHARSA